MQRRYSLAHLILASVVVLSLTPLMVAIDAQARIAFMSDRDWNWEIYVMDNHGGNQRNLTNNPGDDRAPPHGPLTANALSSRLIGMVSVKST